MPYLLAYQHLRNSLPRQAIAQIQHENSGFCNYVDRVKDCYLITSAWECERCFYGRNLHANLDCVDCIDVHECELCYESIGLKNCYNVNFSQECENCQDCEYSAECKSCKNCFLCVNLRHAKHHILNKPYSPEKFAQLVRDFKTHDEAREKNARTTSAESFLLHQLTQLRLAHPQVATHGHSNEHCTGDYIFNNQNCTNCYETKECRDLINVNEGFKCEDSVDVHITEFSRLNFDCVSAYKLHNSNFCYNCWESADLEYCEQCFQCEHCMFCVFLKHKRFHILNKPYSPEEYKRLKAQIIAEMKAEGSYAHEHIPSTYTVEDSVVSDWSFTD